MDLAQEAILEGTFNNPKWLYLKLSELTGVEVESSDFEVASSEAPLVISDEDIEKSDETEVKTEAVKLPFDEIKDQALQL